MMKMKKGTVRLSVPLIMSLLFISSLIIFSHSAKGAGESELYFSKGLLALEEGRLEEAAIEFEKALQLEPENPNILFQLGRTYNRLKEFDDAINNFEKALKINPQLKGINYELGIAYFNIGEFEKALGELDIAIKEEPQRGEAYYYKALAYFRMDNWKEALPNFKKALEMVPDYSLTSHYYLGVSYFRLREDEKALKEFEEAEKLGAGSDIGESAKKFIDAIRKRISERKPWSFYGLLSWQYDDNVTLRPSDLHIVIKKVGDIKDKGDWRAVFNFGGEYKLINTKSFTFSGRYSLYQSVHRRLRAYNLTGNQLSPGFSYRVTDRLSINMAYLFDYYELDETRYLESHTLLPSITLIETKSALLQGFYRFQEKDYLQDPKTGPFNRRGRNYALGVSQYLFFMNNKGYIRLAYVAEREDTKGRDWEYIGNSLGTDMQIPMIFNTKLLMSFTWDKKDYRHINSIFGDRRKDQEYEWSVEVVKDLGKFYALSVKFNRIVNDSELAFYNYDREITSLNFTARF